MTTITKASVFDQRRSVTLDPYGPNPLEQDMKGSPSYQLAKRSGVPVPKMFQGGSADLPVFTASGIDPQLLMQLPYTARHYVAAEPDIAAVHGIFERHANEPDTVLPHEGLNDAVHRMSHWAANAGVDPQREVQDALTAKADERGAADLAKLSPERRAAIHAAQTAFANDLAASTAAAHGA